MTSTQAVETSVNVTSNHPSQDYTHRDDHIFMYLRRNSLVPTIYSAYKLHILSHNKLWSFIYEYETVCEIMKVPLELLSLPMNISVQCVVILHKLACISVSRDLLLCNLTSWSFARRH